MKKIMFVANTSWYIYNFRHGIIEKLLELGNRVQVLAPKDKFSEKLEEMGCEYFDIATDGKSKNPIKDSKLMWDYYQRFKIIKPDYIFNSTIKPNIYGTLAAEKLGIPTINNVSGLGNIFINDNATTKIVKTLYRRAYKSPKKVFFQNDDDMNLFIREGLVEGGVCGRLPGSGVNLERFRPMEREGDKKVKFLLIARMLWDKGIGEYIEAARYFKKEGIDVEFQLLGHLDFDNPTAITRKQMDEWVEEGIVRYLGLSEDVRQEMKDTDCIVLPSAYREGVPKTLIEAAAMEKPIITTDNVGCRDIVDHEYNGFLCQPRDVESLIRKMKRFIDLTPEERIALGKNGREKVKKEFDEKIVIERYLEELI